MGTTAQPGTGDPSGVGAAAAVTPPVPETAEQPQAEEFDRTTLHPVLRDMSPTQINELFSTLLTTVRQPSASEPAAPTAPPPPAALTKDQMKELFDPSSENFDPQAAIKLIAEQSYGPMLGDINRRAMSGIYANLRNRLHDFSDYEADIDRTLSNRDPRTIGEADVFGIYLTAKGMRTLNAERAALAKAKGATTTKPSPAKETPVTPELTDDEKRVAQVMFPNATDPVAEYIKNRERFEDQRQTLKVPVGRDKDGNLIMK